MRRLARAAHHLQRKRLHRLFSSLSPRPLLLSVSSPFPLDARDRALAIATPRRPVGVLSSVSPVQSPLSLDPSRLVPAACHHSHMAPSIDSRPDCVTTRSVTANCRLRTAITRTAPPRPSCLLHPRRSPFHHNHPAQVRRSFHIPAVHATPYHLYETASGNVPKFRSATVFLERLSPPSTGNNEHPLRRIPLDKERRSPDTAASAATEPD